MGTTAAKWADSLTTTLNEWVNGPAPAFNAAPSAAVKYSDEAAAQDKQRELNRLDIAARAEQANGGYGAKPGATSRDERRLRPGERRTCGAAGAARLAESAACARRIGGTTRSWQCVLSACPPHPPEAPGVAFSTPEGAHCAPSDHPNSAFKVFGRPRSAWFSSTLRNAGTLAPAVHGQPLVSF